MRKKIRWNRKLAYVVGLIATDGSLSKDGRHINVTSKDTEQLHHVIKILDLKCPVTRKTSGYNSQGFCYQVQFSNVKLYRFLYGIGLTPNKSKTIALLAIPDRFIIDFIRGSLDGDGYTYSYWDPRWRSSFMMYMGFTSASEVHLKWLSSQIEKLYGLRGSIRAGTRAYKLEYSKSAALVLVRKIYYKRDLICLSRKRFKIETALSIIAQLTTKVVENKRTC